MTEEDYQHWLERLLERFRKAMEQGGFEGSKRSLALRRHALERRDMGYSAFMQYTLSPETGNLSSNSVLPLVYRTDSPFGHLSCFNRLSAMLPDLMSPC